MSGDMLKERCFMMTKGDLNELDKVTAFSPVPISEDRLIRALIAYGLHHIRKMSKEEQRRFLSDWTDKYTN